MIYSQAHSNLNKDGLTTYFRDKIALFLLVNFGFILYVMRELLNNHCILSSSVASFREELEEEYESHLSEHRS